MPKKGSGSGLTGERKKQRLKAAVFLELKNHTGQPGATTGVDIMSMTELRTKTAPLFSPEANEPWFWQRQNRRRNWKVQRSQPGWCPACNDAISQIFISFQCLALIFVVTEKLAQDVDKKWFFEKGVVTGRALPQPELFRCDEYILSGLTLLGDFHNKMRKTGRHCDCEERSRKQSRTP
jgi:hypothetical protein